jgi:tyrosyl-tRNA synthetase
MAKPVTDQKQIENFLTHAVEHIYPSREALKKKLTSGERMTIYHGIDPTGPTLHLGHTIPLRKLGALQKLGHRVVLLIGDFTAMIGDPTDKTATRKKLTREEVLNNCARYKDQASLFLSFDGTNAAEFRFNSEWLAKMSFADVVELASHFTVQQMLERDMFEARMDEGKPIHLHEFLYPLMQGYDSVALDTDMELGGNDQTFNMLAGRTLLKEVKHKEKFVLTTKLLVDATGKKMGKTEGNMVSLVDTPSDMFGKVMSWPDTMIVPGFELCADATSEEIKKIEQEMKKGENPMAFKRELGRRIVTLLANAEEAANAEGNFDRVHKQHEAPEEILEVKMKKSVMSLVDALVEGRLVSSKSDARRQIEQGGIKVDDRQITNVKAEVIIGSQGIVLQKGKRHFVRLVV